MSPAMEKYRHWEKRLIIQRTKTAGYYSPDEDPIIDEMTDAWEQLTAEEQAVLDAEGPQAPNRLADDVGSECMKAGWPRPGQLARGFLYESGNHVRTGTSILIAKREKGTASWSDSVAFQSEREYEETTCI